MKKIVLLLMALLIVGSVGAQRKLNVELKSGKVEIYDLDDVQQVVVSSFEVGAWVDLGLPSGTLWSTCNVGATNPFENGKYFTWDDANRLNRDGGRLPSKEEMEELVNSCTWQLGPDAIKIGTSKFNRAVIYLPAAGDAASPNSGGGRYWGAEDANSPDRVVNIYFNAISMGVRSYYANDYRYSVRLVKK